MHNIMIFLWLLHTLVGTIPNAPPDLLVTIRDGSGRGVAQAQIQVRGSANGDELARSSTDAEGRAVISSVPVDAVRVLVTGTLPNGGALRLSGDDTTGIQVFLAEPPTTLDLRVEADGTLVPDPVTMIVPNQAVPLQPTAPLRVPSVNATASLSIATQSPEVMSVAPVAAPPYVATGNGYLTVLLAFIVALIGYMLWRIWRLR